MISLLQQPRKDCAPAAVYWFCVLRLETLTTDGVDSPSEGWSYGPRSGTSVRQRA